MCVRKRDTERQKDWQIERLRYVDRQKEREGGGKKDKLRIRVCEKERYRETEREAD